MKRPFEMAGALALACLISAQTAVAEEGWPRCSREDNCPDTYLNVVTRQGDARLLIGPSCAGAWRHIWGKRDAHQTIMQWLDASAVTASGSLCIPLHPDVNEIRIASTGGHCGEVSAPEISSASKPGGGAVLRRSFGGAAAVALPGCHARIGNAQIGEIAYGGIALDFSDGYGFGDSYAKSHFYGVYDGFDQGRVRPLGASVYAISEFNTYHYRVEILARGQDGWTWFDLGDNTEDHGR